MTYPYMKDCPDYSREDLERMTDGCLPNYHVVQVLKQHIRSYREGALSSFTLREDVAEWVMKQQGYNTICTSVFGWNSKYPDERYAVPLLLFDSKEHAAAYQVFWNWGRK
jgi:hypothetical protein